MFDAVAGMQRTKEALLLLAVDPSLRGVLMAAAPGSGKSLLARAFGAVFGGLVELPAGVTIDRLLGGVDVGRALRTGGRTMERGLLSRAHGGVLYADNVDLLAPGVAHQLAQALEMRAIRLEREGLSAELPADFVFVGSYGGDCALPPALRDAVALHVFETDPPSTEERLAVLRHPETAGGCARADIHSARRLLPHVGFDADGERRLLATAMALGARGHRGDIFAVRCARARAALHGRSEVTEDDLAAAERLVLYPRATAEPAQAERASGEELPQHREGAASGRETIVAPAACEAPTLPFARRAKPGNRGRYVRAAKERGGAIALEATVRAAAVRGGRRITGDDLRYKRFQRRSGILMVFAVDASGSMAVNRLHEAKGAVLQLLEGAYVHRDRVALVAFGGRGVEVLLAPTRSVEQARRAIDALPSGGGTPLAAGVAAALEVAARSPESEAMLVLLTDGRANVARAGDAVQPDLERACAAVRRTAVASIVIDTANRFASTGDARRVAGLLGASYLPLPRPRASAIFDAVAAEARALRRGGPGL